MKSVLRLLWFGFKVATCIAIALLLASLPGTVYLGWDMTVFEIPMGLALFAPIFWSVLTLFLYEGLVGVRLLLPRALAALRGRHAQFEETHFLSALSAFAQSDLKTALKSIHVTTRWPHTPPPECLILEAMIVHQMGDAPALERILRRLEKEPQLQALVDTLRAGSQRPSEGGIPS